MFIKSITTNWAKGITRTTNFGKFKNFYITVDSFKDKNGIFDLSLFRDILSKNNFRTDKSQVCEIKCSLDDNNYICLTHKNF